MLPRVMALYTFKYDSVCVLSYVLIVRSLDKQFEDIPFEVARRSALRCVDLVRGE